MSEAKRKLWKSEQPPMDKKIDDIIERSREVSGRNLDAVISEKKHDIVALEEATKELKDKHADLLKRISELNANKILVAEEIDRKKILLVSEINSLRDLEISAV